MLFNSFIFFIFLLIVLPTVYLLPPKSRRIFLLLASYFFYGYWDWRFTSLLLLSTVVDYFVGAAIFRENVDNKRKKLLFISLFSNLGILWFFKYFSFFTGSFNEMAGQFGFSLDYVHLNIILPVGISFYTFQTLSYTIDIYRKEMEPEKSFINFALFVSFFPQLVAGPIERAKNLIPQLPSVGKPSAQYMREGVVLITIGLFRKVMIGDATGKIVDHIFAEPHLYGWLELSCGLLLFAFQIYNDFAGYSHIARGTARLLNIDLMENFQQPYFSKSITEFWRRWHISLSSWLRDYLYIPLGGNRKGKRRTYINLLLTMLLGGLWHGANWTFVAWGGLHGSYLAIHKLIINGKNRQKIFKNEDNTDFSLSGIAKITGTFMLVLLTWLFFRAENFSSAFLFIQRIFSFSQGSEGARLLLITIVFSIFSFIIDRFEYKYKEHAFPLRFKPAVYYPVLAVMAFYTFLYMFQSEAAPFIYFQF